MRSLRTREAADLLDVSPNTLRTRERTFGYLGLGSGASCIGCCWALMFVMFAIGMANLAWMLVLAAVMAFEKLAPAGRAAPPYVATGLPLAGLVAGLT